MKKLLLASIVLALMLIVPAYAATVTRSINPASPAVGSVVTVTLSVATTSTDKAVLIEDTAPYAVTGLSSNVVSFGKVSQTPISSYSETYTFTVPTGESGTKSFSGKYTTNGANEQQVGGTTQFTIGTVGCTNACTASQCSATTAYRVCSDTNADGCTELGTAVNCASGQTCSGNGVCSVTGCTSACTPAGTKQCSTGSAYQTCSDTNSDGCTEWGSPVACGGTLICSGAGNCVSGGGSCAGKTCGPDGAGGSCGTCSTAQNCAAGQCVAKPATATCIDSSTGVARDKQMWEIADTSGNCKFNTGMAMLIGGVLVGFIILTRMM